MKMDLSNTLQTKGIRTHIENCLNIDLSLRTRKRNYVYARAVYFKLCKEYTRLSLNDIGLSINMDHASVLHAINNVFPLVMQYDGHLQDLYEDYKLSNKYDTESMFESYSRIIRENMKLRREIKNIKEEYGVECGFEAVNVNTEEGLVDKEFMSLYREIPEAKKEDVYTKLDTIVKVAKIFHEKDTVQS